MPLLQYKCTKCNKRFDELVQVYTDKVVCPDCGGETERDYSGEMFSSTGKQTKKCSGNCKTCGGVRGKVSYYRLSSFQLHQLGD